MRPSSKVGPAMAGPTGLVPPGLSLESKSDVSLFSHERSKCYFFPVQQLLIVVIDSYAMLESTEKYTDGKAVSLVSWHRSKCLLELYIVINNCKFNLSLNHSIRAESC